MAPQQNHPDDKSTFDYPKIIALLEQQGKKLFGQHFHFRQQDQPTLLQLAVYFLQDQTKATELKINLHKGILLSGPIGCGKTSLMTLMRHITPPQNNYPLKSCRDITFEFIKHGYDIIHRYSDGIIYETGAKNYCFDDLGVENNIKYYGNECNVMAEILLSRYDLYVRKKIKTHITTNLSATEIENFYGNRVRSRLRELCNLIAFTNATVDKRK